MNIPALPDNIYKIILLLSILSIYVSISNMVSIQRDTDNSYTLYQDAFDTVKVAKIERDFFKTSMFEKSKEVSLRYGVENFFSENDSMVLFKQIYNSGKDVQTAQDLLAPLWVAYKNKGLQIDLLTVTEQRRREDFNRVKSDNEFNMNFLGICTVIAFAAFLISADNIAGDINPEKRKHSYTEREKGKISKWCQSCGRVFSSVINPGKNSDMSINYSFCERCFKDGKFTQDDDEAFKIILSEFEESKKHLNFIDKRIISKRFKVLDRWRKDPY